MAFMNFKSILLCLLITTSLFSQESETSELYLTLKKQDSLFFERGFNQCDLEYLEKHVAKDLKFYHDQSGFQDRDLFFENTRKYLCSNPAQKPIRRIVKGSLVVFPLFNDGVLYGAIQSGIHRFYIREKGKEEVYTSTAKFTHVWIWEDNILKLSEALSYDHKDERL